MNNPSYTIQRPDFAAIASWIKSGSSVLDLGCGDGSLLKYLSQERNALGYGVEIDDANILACVKNNINVIQSDLEGGLSVFESRAFDYVILSQTLQTIRHTENIIAEMLRVGHEGIVTFPNFGYWRNRWQVVMGTMPKSKELPYDWYDTPNVHLCTIHDFEKFCQQHQIRILERVIINDGTHITFLPNVLGSLAVFRFQRGK